MKEIFAFTGGGTGGHILPGLAVAEYLRNRFPGEIVWIGSGTDMERAIVERWGLRFYPVPSGKLRRYLSFKNFLDAFRILAGIVSSFFLLMKLKPRLLFSKGGFVSVPPVIAARLLGIRIFTHESDFDPGLATRINSRFADGIFTAYEETGTYFPENIRQKVIVSGNPVRAEILSGSRDNARKLFGIRNGLPVLLVLGGSQGSQEINAFIAEILDDLCRDCFVIHQTGDKLDRLERKENYLPVPFMTGELPDALAAADLVVCRSGASTIWENAALGKAAILIPLSGSGTRGDQVRNARYFSDHGAAVVLEDSERNSAALLSVIRDLMNDPERIAEVRKAALSIGKRNAAEVIGTILLENGRNRT